MAIVATIAKRYSKIALQPLPGLADLGVPELAGVAYKSSWRDCGVFYAVLEIALAALANPDSRVFNSLQISC